ncbi:MAG TPA: universal stress protein [Candidatus Limnocylindrales bacterium]|nr:universal stress protein [Candidatus Limnocylindrales bacterium]
MSPFASILVPLDGSRVAARSLGCATWLAARLGARLHILSATPRERPAREELTRLQVPEEHWPLVTLLQAPAYPEDAILAAVARHDVSLVVMSAVGETAEAGPAADADSAGVVGHVTRAILERSPVPVLLLPPAYRETLPWERLLVPVSGEPEGDEALALAVRLANALGLEVHVAHVAGADTGDESLAARARYADAIHHEYPHQLQELVARALPHCGAEESRCIVDVALCHGDVAGELLGLMERKRVSVLVVGWHGRFATGRASILKHLIRAISSPVLLVKRTVRRPFRLKVGEEIER